MKGMIVMKRYLLRNLHENTLHGCFIERFLLILLVFCLSIILFTPNSLAQEAPASETMETLYQKCKVAYAKGNFDSARENIEKFLSLYPKSPNADEILFMQAFLQPSIHASMQGYQQIIENYSQSKWLAKSHFQLGQLYYFLGDYDKALENYGRIIVSYSDDDIYWAARYWRCKVLIAKKDYEGAISALRSLADASVKEIGKDVILMALGSCYVVTNDYENAIATYRTLIETLPGSSWVPTAYILIVKSLQSTGKGEEGKPFLQKIMATYPDSIEAKQAKEMLDSLSLNRTDAVSSNQSSSEAVTEKQETPPSNTSKATSGPYYSVQVGAFSSKKAADDLATSLSKKGYFVDIQMAKSRSGSLYKVRVGKLDSRNEAEKIERVLKSKEKLPTKIVYE